MLKLPFDGFGKMLNPLGLSAVGTPVSTALMFTLSMNNCSPQSEIFLNANITLGWLFTPTGRVMDSFLHWLLVGPGGLQHAEFCVMVYGGAVASVVPPLRYNCVQVEPQ